MKKPEFFYPGLFLWVLVLLIISDQVQAQKQQQDSDFAVNVDLYSSYVWRGTRLGNGPSVQPSVKYTYGGLTAGVWGAYDARGYAEADPWVSYEFPYGLSLGFTDYYYPGLDLFDVSEATGSHAFEINLGFTRGDLSLTANYILNKAGGAASAGGDKYFQAEYSLSRFSLFLGAGDGWHTSDGKFAVCNIGLGTSREIRLSDSFTIPVSGQIIVNPEREQLYVVAGFSF